MDVFTIGMVAKMTGLSEFTLRAWEKRYGTPMPNRSDSGRRVYTIREIEKLRLLKKLISLGHAIGEIANLDSAKLNSLLKHDAKGLGPKTSIAEMLAAIEVCDVHRLDNRLKAAQLASDSRSFVVNVVSPLLGEIGRRVAEGSLDVYHEHAASAVVRNVLTSLLHSSQQLPMSREGKPIVFATPQNDYHEFGILISAILLALNGGNAFYLGPNMPAESLAQAASSLKAAAVVIGCTTPTEVLPPKLLKEFMNKFAERTDSALPIWLGGSRAKEAGQIIAAKKRKVTIMSSYHDLDHAWNELN